MISEIVYVDDLPKAIIRDLAHDGIQTPVAEFKYHFSDHYITDPY